MSNVFGFPITAPSIKLTDAAGLATGLVTADEVATPLVRPDPPLVGSGVAGEDLQVAAANGASSASTAGGKGGNLELFAGDAGTGTAAANGGSVILQPGSGHAPGLSGIVRADGPMVTRGGLVNLAAGGSAPAPPLPLNPGQIRAGLLYGLPTNNATYNLPTDSVLVDEFPGIQVDDVIRFSVANLSGFTITVVGVGIVPVGSAVIQANQSGSFALIAKNVSPGTEDFDLYRIS